MKRLLFAGIVAMTSAVASAADERQDAIQTIARVLVFQRLCPRIEIDMAGPVLPLMSSYGIDFDHDQREVLTEVQRQAAPWAGKSEQAICSTALTLYGPNGDNMRGLLREK